MISTVLYKHPSWGLSAVRHMRRFCGVLDPSFRER
jgi:hypothetical protein